MDSAMKFQQQYKKDEANQMETDRAFSNVVKRFEKLREASLNFLIKEILLDIDCEINKVGTFEWLSSNDVIENVRLTLMDYFSDYKYLKDSNLNSLKILLQRALAKSYISAILSK